MNASTITRGLLAQIAIVFIIVLVSGAARATTFYIWNIDVTWDVLQELVDAMTLKIDNLRNFDNNDNDLWIHLLDGDATQPNLVVLTDNQDGVDYFDGQGLLLEHYEDLTTTPHDKYHYFTQAELDKVNEYAADGRIALAFDPDCHFYNCGVKLTACTTAVPEPSVVALGGFALGLLGIVRLRKGRK
jgi:hypothetical protein